MKQMDRGTIDGVELEYEIRGTGEPVVLVHAGVFADWFKPLLEEPSLTGRYRVLNYHRAGYAGSSRVAGPVSIAQQAAHLRSLLRHLGIERAHIVGHSSGGNIALQLALGAPDVVGSLALLEPALVAPSSGSQKDSATIRSSFQIGPVLQLYGAGDKAGAVDAWMRGDPSTAQYYLARAIKKERSGDKEGALRDRQRAIDLGYQERVIPDSFPLFQARPLSLDDMLANLPKPMKFREPWRLKCLQD